jgi:hypothetical protein
MIDNRGDFKAYMQNYAYARGPATPRGPRREGPPDEGFVRPIALLFTNCNRDIHSFRQCQHTSQTGDTRLLPPMASMASKTVDGPLSG